MSTRGGSVNGKKKGRPDTHFHVVDLEKMHCRNSARINFFFFPQLAEKWDGLVDDQALD